MAQHKIRLGIIGGGAGSMIGDIHRLSALHTGRFEVVAGALSSSKERADASAAKAGIPLDRSYGHYEDMASAEAARADGVEAVAILTPNALHAPVAQAFLKHGVHIICEKPMTGDLPQADALAAAVTAAGVAFIVTHSYTALTMVRRAREIIRSGALGDLRTIHSSYMQDGHVALERDPASTNWHLDPARSGIAGSLADIGSHAFHIATWLTGLELDAVAADLSALGVHKRLDNDGNALLRFKGGAKGNLSFSQMAVGKGNGLSFFLYGSKGSLGWSVETPNELRFTLAGKSTEILTPAADDLAQDAHWEKMGFGPYAPYASAFTRLYDDAAEQIIARRDGRTLPPMLAPSLAEGHAVMRFVDAAVRSSANGATWVKP